MERKREQKRARDPRRERAKSMVKRERGQMRERAKLTVKKGQREKAVFCVRDLCEELVLS